MHNICRHTTKIRYQTWDDAHDDMVKIARRAGENKHPIRVYACDKCKGYHLTSAEYTPELRPVRLKHANDFKKFMQ